MYGRHQKSTALVCWCERHPVGVAEELLRLATFTTEFDIKAVIADRAVYCFEVVCEHVQKELRGTENEFTLGSRKLSHDQQPRSDLQTFSNILGLGQKFVDEVLTIKGGSTLVANWLICRPGEASEDANVGGMVSMGTPCCLPRSRLSST